MPSSEPQRLPDIAVGRHPDFGIVASNPKHLAASAWMLKGFGFHPVPGHRDLYALADQDRDGQARATRAVALLRKARYHVDADAAFDSAVPEASATHDRPVRAAEPVRADPDVAFAEHPQLGMVAATGALCSVRGRQLLVELGWKPRPALDIYTLPPGTRAESLGSVARTTVEMNRAGLQAAVSPGLAREVTDRRTAALPEPTPSSAPRTFPALSAAALAASPARAGLPGPPPFPAPATVPPAGGVNPRASSSSRTR